MNDLEQLRENADAMADKFVKRKADDAAARIVAAGGDAMVAKTPDGWKVVGGRGSKRRVH